MDDINGLVEKTSLLIEDNELRKKMATNGLCMITDFDAKEMAKNYYTLYDILLKDKNDK